jgi:hypothetical protein
MGLTLIGYKGIVEGDLVSGGLTLGAGVGYSLRVLIEGLV